MEAPDQSKCLSYECFFCDTSGVQPIQVTIQQAADKGRLWSALLRKDK